MSTIVVDFKSDSVDSNVNAVRNEDGSITLNLDTFFEDRIKYETHVWEDGRSGDTFALDSFPKVKLASGRVIHRGVDIYDYYSFGGWSKSSFNRVVDFGELVEGPHAYVNILGVSVTAHRQPDEVAIYIEAGDKVILGDALYNVVKLRNTNRIELELAA